MACELTDGGISVPKHVGVDLLKGCIVVNVLRAFVSFVN